jgi:hypothetical protein
MDDLKDSGIETPIVSSEQASSPPEKMLPASEVNNIVKWEKHRAAEAARREMQEAHEAELQRVRSEMAVPKVKEEPRTELAASGINKEELKKELFEDLLDKAKAFKEEEQERAQKAKLDELSQQYYLKMGQGSEAETLPSDYKEVMADFNPWTYPYAALLAGQVVDGNLQQVMYELVSNPSKLIEINDLAQKSESMATRQLKKLAASVTKNLTAKASNAEVPPPLKSLKPSTVGMDAGRPMTIKDFKNVSWLRG